MSSGLMPWACRGRAATVPGRPARPSACDCGKIGPDSRTQAGRELTAVRVLPRFLLEQKSVPVTGAGIAESTISEVLAGKRKLNRGQIAKLARYFHIEPGRSWRNELPAPTSLGILMSEDTARSADSRTATFTKVSKEISMRTTQLVCPRCCSTLMFSEAIAAGTPVNCLICMQTFTAANPVYIPVATNSPVPKKSAPPAKSSTVNSKPVPANPPKAPARKADKTTPVPTRVDHETGSGSNWALLALTIAVLVLLTGGITLGVWKVTSIAKMHPSPNDEQIADNSKNCKDTDKPKKNVDAQDNVGEPAKDTDKKTESNDKKPDAEKEPADLLPEDVRKAWEKAGFKTGWMSEEPFSFHTGEVGQAGEIRSFSGRVRPGVMLTLPTPEMPFGLQGGSASLYDIADFKQLQTRILHIPRFRFIVHNT
jgi:hypothetical protein